MVIKLWIKWGVVCESLTSSCQVSPKKHLGPICPKLCTSSQSPCKTKFLKKKKWSEYHKIMNKVRGCLWKSGKWLPSYALKLFLAHLPQIFVLGSNSHSRLQSLDGLNLHTKMLSNVCHKILNKMRGCLRKSDKWLPSYGQKSILDPYAPSLQTRSQSPCENKFLQTKVWSVYNKIMNKFRFFL